MSGDLEVLDRVRPLVPELHVLDAHRPLGALRGVLPTPDTVARVARRWGADVILHPMVNPLTTPALVWLGLASTPLVTVVHDAVAHEGDRHRGMELAVRTAIWRSTAVVAPSNEVARTIDATTGRAAHVIPLGPHLALDDGWDPNGPVLMVGRLRRYKGLDLLAEAWDRLPAAGRPRLRIVGESSGDPAVDASLRRLSALGAEVEERWIPEPELPAVLHGARLVVLPYREATQSGVVEIARSARIPVLATDVGALRDQVGRGGVVVDATADALAAGLGQLLDAPTALEAIHRELLDVDDVAVWDALAERFEAVLRDAAGRGGQRLPRRAAS